MTKIKSALLLLSAVAVGCSDSGSDKKKTGDSGTPSGWQAAVGAHGAFAQTFDGVHWSVRSLTPRDLYAVTCVGNLDGWAVGAEGFIGRTRDGGENWQAQSSGTTLALRAVHFAHDEHHAETTSLVGVAAGDSGKLLVSTNGGDEWKPVDAGTQVDFKGAASALNADLLVVVGAGGTVVRSLDLGKTWQSTTLSGAGDLRGVAVAPSGSPILGVDSKGQIWSSQDLGKSFTVAATAPGPLNGVALAPDGSLALVAGDAGVAMQRGADGTWTNVVTGTSARLFAALVTHDGEREYLAGESGTLLGREKAAETWEKTLTGGGDTFYGLEDLDPH